MTIRLVCIDVDGTMIGSSGVVHEDVWRAVERARAGGVRLAISSGRPAFGTTRLLAERLEPDGWHSCQNGASVMHRANGRSRASCLPAATVAMLTARSRAAGRLLELYTDHDYVIEQDAPVARMHASLLGLAFAPRPLESLAEPVVRAQWLLPMADAAAALAEPHPGLVVSPSTSPLMPETLFVNLTRTGVDKGSAVRALSAEYGIPLNEIMYVGDGLNDLPALAIVGHPVAMANAEPEALALATRVVGHVDDGGLAEALALVA